MIGRVRGATDPPPDANAPKEVASKAIPARPMMSSRFAMTLATAKTYIFLAAGFGKTALRDRSDIAFNLLIRTSLRFTKARH